MQVVRGVRADGGSEVIKRSIFRSVEFCSGCLGGCGIRDC